MANETIDITVFETPDIVNLNITPNLIEINIIQSEGGNNILQFDSLANFPATGSVDFIYLAKDTNRIYRWNGSAYVEISGSASLVWGAITGTLSNQTDLQNALNAKQDDLNGTGFVKVSGTTVSYDNNTYALDSEVVKLTGSQSIAGTKTFTGYGQFENGVFIKQDGTLQGIVGYNTFDANTTSVIFSLPNTNSAAEFKLSNITERRFFDLPNANGTIALTSDIPSLTNYVTLNTAQTITADKTFSGAVINDGDLYIKQDATYASKTGYVSLFAGGGNGVAFNFGNSNINQNLNFPATGRAYLFPDASGTLALTSDIPTNSGTVTSVALTVPSAFSVSGSPITSSGTLAITATGDTSQYIRGDGTLATLPSVSGFVPYTGATANLDLGTHTIIAAKGTFSSSGSGDTVGITHSSGSGIALNISKSGNGEGLYINKSSGSGNAVTVIGTLNATTLVKSGGTSTQFLKADGSTDSNTYLTTDNASTTYLPLTGGILTGTTRMDGSGSTTEPISMVFNTGINRLLTPVLRLYGSTNVSSNYVELFGTSATQNRTVNFPDASGTIALTSDLHNSVTIGTANGLSLSTQVLSLGLASTSTTGALSSTDWNTFNNKASTASLANYLPLSGGTLTGTLNGTAANFAGNLLLTNANPTLSFNTTTTVNTTMLQIIGAQYVANAPFNANRIVALNQSHIAFEAGGAERLRITNGGTLVNASGIYDTSPGSLWYARQGGNNRIIADGNGYIYMPFLTTGSGIDTMGWWGSSGGSYASNGMLMRISSSIRYKKNIRSLEIDSSKIFELNTISYENNENTAVDGLTSFGLLAEDVAEKIPQLATYNNNNQPEGVQYNMLSVLLLEEIKKMKAELEILKNK